MQTLLLDRDIALSGDDRFVSLEAKNQYFRELQWMEPLSEEEKTKYYTHLIRGKQEQGKASPNQWRLMLARDAHQALMHAYLPLVSRIATRVWHHIGRKMDLMDLIQIGNMALFKALERGSSELEYGMLNYIAVRVKGEIISSLSEERHAIRIPHATVCKAKKQGQEQDLLCLWNVASIEQDLNTEGEWSLLDTLEAPAFILSPFPDCSAEKVHLLALLLAELPPREREVMQLRYGLGSDAIAYAHQEIADLLETSELTVKTYEQNALVRLQNLVAKYEQETGQSDVRWLDGDERFIAYLEQRRQEKAVTPPATRAVNAQVQQAYTAMQKAGEPIKGAELARRAGVSRSLASRYLQLMTERRARRSPQEVHACLEQAYTAIQKAGEPIKGAELARRAGVSVSVVWRYLKKRGA